MGAADVVPGVSGGTVALVFGIYQRLIDSVRTGSMAMGRFLKADIKGSVEALKQVEWLFFIPLVLGIMTAVFSLSGLIAFLLEDYPVETAGMFMGLVAGSVIVAWELLKTRDPQRFAVLIGVAIVTFLLLGLKEGTSDSAVSQVSDAPIWVFFGAGAIAICAMILPGVSGSFLLVTMGMYGPTLAAVNDRDLATVAVFALGCVVGLALFSQVLHWGLSNHYDTIMAGLIGLMLGSLRVVWPWPNGVDSTAIGAPSDPVVVPALLIVAGILIVIAFNAIGKRFEHRTTEDEIDELQSV